LIVVLFISLCPRIRDKHSSECSSSRISWATTSDVESEGGGKYFQRSKRYIGGGRWRGGRRRGVTAAQRPCLLERRSVRPRGQLTNGNCRPGRHKATRPAPRGTKGGKVRLRSGRSVAGRTRRMGGRRGGGEGVVVGCGCSQKVPVPRFSYLLLVAFSKPVSNVGS